jgi:shikimate kinase
MDKVFLVGLPASGKTTIGKWLSQKMNWAFLDLDECITDEFQISVRDFFDQFGEAAFREKETEILRSTETMTQVIIACGGGTAAHSDNMKWMQERGITVFLNIDLGTIQTRIHANPHERPLFEGKNLVEIREKLQEMLTNRGDFYHKSKIIWNKSIPNDYLHLAVNQMVINSSLR